MTVDHLYRQRSGAVVEGRVGAASAVQVGESIKGAVEVGAMRHAGTECQTVVVLNHC